MKRLFIYIFCLIPFLAMGAPLSEKDVTYFVLQNGDGSLSQSMLEEFEKMKAVGSTERVNIVVLQDLGSIDSSKIWYVRKGEADLVYDFKSNIDTGDWQTLVDYFSFVKKNFPAQKYILNISSHGSGWLDSYASDEKGISYDETSNNHITTFQLGKALEKIKALNDGKKLFVFEMFACIMASLEVLYEIADSVEYVMASPQLTYSEDTHYQEILTYLTNHPDSSGEEYLRNTLQPSEKTTNSFFVGFSTRFLEPLAISINRYSAYLQTLFKSKPEEVIAGITRWDTIAYKVVGYRRLDTLLSGIKQNIKDVELSRLTADLNERIKDVIIAQNDPSKNPLQGLSIWLPLIKSPEAPTQKRFYTEYHHDYVYLKWEKATNWLSFINQVAIYQEK